MKTLLASLACLGLWFAASPSATAQHYDTCAPHRHGLYGYVNPGYGFGAGHGRGMARPVRPFQGLVNPRYLHSPVEYVVVAPINRGSQPEVYLPREIRERKQAEMEIASGSDILTEPAPREPTRPRPEEYDSPAAGAPPQSASTPPPRAKVPQPTLIAAKTYASEGQPGSRRSPMTSRAADDYVARSAAALARLKAHRTAAASRVAEGSTVASATDGTLRN